eukprot:1853873-Rhodomonas_salina.3
MSFTSIKVGTILTCDGSMDPATAGAVPDDPVPDDPVQWTRFSPCPPRPNTRFTGALPCDKGQRQPLILWPTPPVPDRRHTIECHWGCFKTPCQHHPLSGRQKCTPRRVEFYPPGKWFNTDPLKGPVLNQLQMPGSDAQRKFTPSVTEARNAPEQLRLRALSIRAMEVSYMKNRRKYHASHVGVCAVDAPSGHGKVKMV